MSAAWEGELARELADEALFDEGVEAARNACVAGASLASAAITAAAWYDNPLTGTPALRRCMERLASLPLDLGSWQRAFAKAMHPETLDRDYSPGFGFVTRAQAPRILAACERLAGGAESKRCAFFLRHHTAISEASGGALNQAGLAALSFVDHGVGVDEAERWFLVRRIDTAVAEAQRTRALGVAKFPFLSESYVYEGARPPAHKLDLDDLKRKVGLA